MILAPKVILISDNMIFENFQLPGIIRFDRTVHNHMVYQKEVSCLWAIMLL